MLCSSQIKNHFITGLVSNFFNATRGKRVTFIFVEKKTPLAKALIKPMFNGKNWEFNFKFYTLTSFCFTYFFIWKSNKEKYKKLQLKWNHKMEKHLKHIGYVRTHMYVKIEYMISWSAAAYIYASVTIIFVIHCILNLNF